MAVTGFVTIRDFNGEVSTTRFWLPNITSVNWTGVTQDLDEIADAIADGGMIRGEVIDVGYTQSFPRSSAAVTDEEAQREKKWVVHYTDTNEFLDAPGAIPNPGYNKKFTFEIATALLTGHMVSGSGEDLADLDEPEVAAMVAALEANVRSPYNNQTAYGTAPFIRIDKIVYAGRRN